MAKSKKHGFSNGFSEADVKRNRTFPIGSTIVLVVLIVLQLFSLSAAIFHKEEPKDLIKSYKIYVTPNDDGTLDIEYELVWKALDKNEPLSWVEIGMANGNFEFRQERSDNIRRLVNESNDGYSYAKVYFKSQYAGGNTVSFNFKVRQYQVLAEKNGQKLYLFTPSWFNYIEVQKYEFYWKKSDGIKRTNADRETADWYVWEGSLGYGEYRTLQVNCNKSDAVAVPYKETKIDAYNGLKSDESSMKVAMVVVILFIGLFEVIIIDSYVSYARGRGFLTGYGHHMHVYGRRNPHYVSAHRAHTSSSRGGSRGGGCACACACACAGGGRAGCSQKDTYKNKTNDK